VPIVRDYSCAPRCSHKELFCDVHHIASATVALSLWSSHARGRSPMARLVRAARRFFSCDGLFRRRIQCLWPLTPNSIGTRRKAEPGQSSRSRRPTRRRRGHVPPVGLTQPRRAGCYWCPRSAPCLISAWDTIAATQTTSGWNGPATMAQLVARLSQPHWCGSPPMISLHASYLIESHSSRSVRAALQITQMSRGQTAGGEMILQPCQPLVHNPLAA